MIPSGYFPPPYLLLWSLYFLYKVRRELGHGWETVFMYPSLLIQFILLITFFESLRNLKLDIFRRSGYIPTT